jgi:DNA repair exonuclease SbcCD ATPase subunit
MLNFEKLIIHNFGSYGHTELDLRNKGFCLVTGKNNCLADNAISNGSGKSFLWNALCFALTGETLNGLHSNLKNINITEDSTCFVEIFFEETGDHYHLIRTVAPKSDLKIIKNDVDISGKGIRESEKKLVEVLPNLTKNLITSTIIIGQGMPNKFSSFSPSGRKDLLEKLTRADFMIEDIKQRVADRQAQLSSDIRVYEDSLLAYTSKLSLIETELKTKTNELLNLVLPDFQQEQAQITERLAELDKVLDEHLKIYSDLKSEYQQMHDQLLKLSEEKARVVADEQEAYTKAALETQQQQFTIKANLEAVNLEIKKLSSVRDTCPTCNQKIPGAYIPDLTQHKEQQTVLTTQLNSISAKATSQHCKHLEYQKMIAAQFEVDLAKVQQHCDRLRTQMTKLETKIAEETNNKTALQTRAMSLKFESENWEKSRQNLQQTVDRLSEEAAGFTDKIAAASQTKLELEEHFKVIKKMDTLIKRDFRGYLLSNIISYINIKAKEYSNIVFNTKELEVYLDGNDLNISYCGKMFDNLSGGEKQRVDLILQFTIRNLLTAYLNFNSNILVLDEITDFLDKKSCNAVLELITKELNTIESVFIVSHHASELALPIDSEVIVRKNEAGISEIISGA